jgi:hypothetical protein
MRWRLPTLLEQFATVIVGMHKSIFRSPVSLALWQRGADMRELICHHASYQQLAKYEWLMPNQHYQLLQFIRVGETTQR